MLRFLFVIVILTGTTNSVRLFSQESVVNFSAYIKSLQSVNIPGNYDTISSSNLIHNRLNLKLNINPNLSLRLEIRNRIFLGDQLRQFPGFGNFIDQDETYLNLSKLWLNNSSIVIHSIIDRLQLQYSNDNFDIRIGRQRINWGIHNFWNPNDLFNTFNFLDFDFEERPGSDAIRLQYFSEDGSTFEAAFKPGKQTDSHTAALLYKINRYEYDFQMLGGIHHSDLVLGGGWAGGIYNTGFKGELSYFIPYKNKNISKPAFLISSMVDRTFEGEWYVSFSTLYQSSEGQPDQLFGSLYGTQLSAKNLFPSKFSMLGGVSKSFSNLLSVNLSVLYATNKNILIFLPTFNWNASENLQIDLTGQSFFSKTNTAYGSLAHAIYLRVKWSF